MTLAEATFAGTLPAKAKKPSARRKALIEVRAEVRADLLLDGFGLASRAIDPLSILDRVTKTLDDMIAKS